MSLASIQYIRISNPSSSYNVSNAVGFRLCPTNKTVSFTSTTIRSSTEPDGTLRRPSIATPPVRPSSNVPQPSPASTPPPPPAKTNVITMEFQRQRAKELQQYFKDKKIEEAANRGPFFGFIAKNEISNGRFVFISYMN